MKKKDKYIEALKSLDGFVIVSEWAETFANMFPEDMESANTDAERQNKKKDKNFTTGLREIAARLSSRTSSGAFGSNIEIDNSERPKRVRFIDDDEKKDVEQRSIEEDIEPLKRNEIIKNAINSLEAKQLYRLMQFEQIKNDLNKWFKTSFEIEHSTALLNQDQQGSHHPDNIQLLIKSHNAKKSSQNWNRFSLKEQIEYINKVIELQKLVLGNFNLEFEKYILEDILDRLKRIY